MLQTSLLLMQGLNKTEAPIFYLQYVLCFQRQSFLLSLEYTTPVWEPHRQSVIKTPDQVQHHAARYVFNDYHNHTPDCVTEMINEHGCERIEGSSEVVRLSTIHGSAWFG